MAYSGEVNGYIGNLISGVIVADAGSQTIYVTLETGILVVARNTRISNTLRMPIKVGYDSADLPTTLQVLEYWFQNGGSGSNNVNYHHAQHEWPGGDLIHVFGEQFLPSLYSPIGLTVDIYPGVYRISAGWKTLAKTNVNLSSYVPTSWNHYKYVMIVVDNTGSLAVREGNDRFVTLASELTFPTPVYGDNCICIVLMFNGMTEIRMNATNNDFIDLRFSGAASGNTTPETLTTISALLNGATTKATPVDADVFDYLDSAASFIGKKFTWANIKAALKIVNDGLYAALSHVHAGTDITSGTIDGDRLPAISTTKKGAVPLTGTPSGKYLKDSGSWDAIPVPALDTLAVPTDITTLNASVTTHGLLPKLPAGADTTKFLNGAGAWATPTGGGGSSGPGYVLITEDLTSQITGATAHFTTSLPMYSLPLITCNVRQLPSDIVLDITNSGFTMSYTPTGSDKLTVDYLVLSDLVALDDNGAVIFDDTGAYILVGVVLDDNGDLIYDDTPDLILEA
jgi:hypothetical protein